MKFSQKENLKILSNAPLALAFFLNNKKIKKKKKQEMY